MNMIKIMGQLPEGRADVLDDIEKIGTDLETFGYRSAGTDLGWTPEGPRLRVKFRRGGDEASLLVFPREKHLVAKCRRAGESGIRTYNVENPGIQRASFYHHASHS